MGKMKMFVNTLAKKLKTHPEYMGILFKSLQSVSCIGVSEIGENG